MRDIMGMMGKVKEMQAKMEQMQAEIAALEVEGRSGGADRRPADPARLQAAVLIGTRETPAPARD